MTALKSPTLKFPRLPTWLLLLLLLPLLFLTASGLRFDFRKMERLRLAVQNADQNNDPASLQSSLQDLKTFALTHTVINITEYNGRTIFSLGTGPLYLENQYTRVATAELEKAKNRLSTASSSGQINIYAEASKVCQPQAIQNGWTWNSKPYIDCMMGELAKHPSSPEINDLFQALLPSANLYRINYTSPLWAPTPVGFLTLVVLLIMIVLIWRTIFWFILQITLLSMRQRS